MRKTHNNNNEVINYVPVLYGDYYVVAAGVAQKGGAEDEVLFQFMCHGATSLTKFIPAFTIFVDSAYDFTSLFFLKALTTSAHFKRFLHMVELTCFVIFFLPILTIKIFWGLADGLEYCIHLCALWHSLFKSKCWPKFVCIVWGWFLPTGFNPLRVSTDCHTSEHFSTLAYHRKINHLRYTVQHREEYLLCMRKKISVTRKQRY